MEAHWSMLLAPGVSNLKYALCLNSGLHHFKKKLKGGPKIARPASDVNKGKKTGQ